MRHRNACICRRGDRGRNAGNDFERNPGARQLLGLFAAAAEDEGIASFEPHDSFSLSRFGNEQLVDLILRQRVRARSLSDIHALASHERRDLRRDERIECDEIGARDQFSSASCE